MKKTILVILFFMQVVAFHVSAQEDYDLHKVQFLGLDGKKINLYDYSNKIVLLSFWATWCDACIKEFEILNDLEKIYPQNVKIIAVSLDENIEKVQSFVKDKKINFLVVKSLDKDLLVRQYLSNSLIPATVIFQRKLEYVASFSGTREVRLIKGMLNPLLL